MKSTRRSALKSMLLAGMAPLLRIEEEVNHVTKGKIRHSVCKWCYKDISLEELSAASSEIGLSSIELLGPEQWKVVNKYDLTCAVGSVLKDGYGIANCFNRKAHHADLEDIYMEAIPLAKKAGIQSLICFSGNKDGIDDEEGLENCRIGLQRIMPVAEKAGINIMMELLNSKVNHPDYQCDRTWWGVELCKRVGSENFKLLYDIYHMQIMEGDVIRTIQDNSSFIGHYHTGGVPGRAEIDETQELNYPAIVKAIADTGYQGFIGQEFIPKKADKLKSLKAAVTLCSV